MFIFKLLKIIYLSLSIMLSIYISYRIINFLNKEKGQSRANDVFIKIWIYMFSGFLPYLSITNAINSLFAEATRFGRHSAFASDIFNFIVMPLFFLFAFIMMKLHKMNKRQSKPIEDPEITEQRTDEPPL